MIELGTIMIYVHSEDSYGSTQYTAFQIKFKMDLRTVLGKKCCKSGKKKLAKFHAYLIQNEPKNKPNFKG